MSTSTALGREADVAEMDAGGLLGAWRDARRTGDADTEHLIDDEVRRRGQTYELFMAQWGLLVHARPHRRPRLLGAAAVGAAAVLLLVVTFSVRAGTAPGGAHPMVITPVRALHGCVSRGQMGDWSQVVIAGGSPVSHERHRIHCY